VKEGMTKFPISPNFQMEAGDQNVRHPERSEANDLFSPSGLIRAQSKDLATFSRDVRSGMNSPHAGPARRLGKEMPFPNATCNGRTTRSFDFGSATPFGKTPVPLAFAQDDGFFKTYFSFRAPRGLKLKPV